MDKFFFRSLLILKHILVWVFRLWWWGWWVDPNLSNPPINLEILLCKRDACILKDDVTRGIFYKLRDFNWLTLHIENPRLEFATNNNLTC